MGWPLWGWATTWRERHSWARWCCRHSRESILDQPVPTSPVAALVALSETRRKTAQLTPDQITELWRNKWFVVWSHYVLGPNNWKRKIGKCFLPVGLYSVCYIPKGQHSINEKDTVSRVPLYCLSLGCGLLSGVSGAAIQPSFSSEPASDLPHLNYTWSANGALLPCGWGALLWWLLTVLKWPSGTWRSRLAIPKYPSRLWEIE